MNFLDFLKKAAKDYRIGALTASSRYAVAAVTRAIRPEFRNIVEYGPGDGVITKEMLKRLPPDGKLVAIETNKEFCKHLKEDIDDPRFTLVEGSVLDLSPHLLEKTGLSRIDAIISGIPFSFFKPKDRESIVEKTAAAISPGGAFIVYQYSLLMAKLLKRHFRSFSYELELRNLPPYFIMRAEKSF